MALIVIVLVRRGSDSQAPKSAPVGEKAPAERTPHTAKMGVIVKDAKFAIRASSKHPSETENAIQMVDGSWGIKRADGSIIGGAAVFQQDEPTIEGAISIRQMMLNHRDEAQVVQRGTDSTRSERDQCMLEFVRRGGKITRQYDWVIALSFESDGQEIQVTKVQVPSALWPEEFDDQVKDCYLQSLARIRFPGTERLDMTVEFPMCVYPP